MKRFFLGLAMILTGLMGMGFTLCGLVILTQWGDLAALFGIIPGGLLLWAAWSLAKALKKLRER